MRIIILLNMQISLIGIQFLPQIVRVVCVGGLGNVMGVSEFLGIQVFWMFFGGFLEKNMWSHNKT